MKFIINVIDDLSNSGTPAEMNEINKFNDQLRMGGQFIFAGGLAAPENADVIDNRNDANLSTGKPLFEANENFSGFWLIEAENIDVARKLAFAPHINIGVFSLEKNSPGWASWQKNLEQTLKSGNIFGSEGLAINMSVYIDDLETEFLPLNCNWIASNLLPKFDEIKNTFVEPYLPNYKIGIMHLAAGIWDSGKDMRLDREVKINIKTIQQKILSKSLRFGH